MFIVIKEFAVRVIETFFFQSVRKVREEMGDLGESLIDVTQGHGGQGLINLLITGRSSPYVWDGMKNVGGLGKHSGCRCRTVCIDLYSMFRDVLNQQGRCVDRERWRLLLWPSITVGDSSRMNEGSETIDRIDRLIVRSKKLPYSLFFFLLLLFYIYIIKRWRQ